MLTFSPAMPISPIGPKKPGSPWRRENMPSQLSLISLTSVGVIFVIIGCSALGLQQNKHTQTQWASNRNQQKKGEKPLPSRQAFRPRQLSRSRPTGKQPISIWQTYSSLSFLVQIRRNVLGGPFPCGNGELTSNLHIFRWYIITKKNQGENVQLRMTVVQLWTCDY